MASLPVPQKITATIVEKMHLTASIILAKFKLVLPLEFDFIAGQFISLKVTDTKFRAYSICSNPSIKNEISLLIAVGHKGLGSDFIKNVQIGSQVEFIGPSGRFFLPRNLDNDLVFIATGTGIAPFISMFYKLNEQSFYKKIKLFFGVRTDEDLMFKNIFDSLQNNLDFEYEYCLSKPSANFKGKKGRVTKYLNAYINSKNVQNNNDYLICGNPNMVEEVSQLLLKANIPQEKIHFEKFTYAKS